MTWNLLRPLRCNKQPVGQYKSYVRDYPNMLLCAACKTTKAPTTQPDEFQEVFVKKIRVFISYSWDSNEHREWVKKLADTLESYDEIHVEWDGYDLDSLSDRNLFMENGVSSADYVLVVSTKEYKMKADARKGGVGIETYLSTAKHWDSLLAEQRTNIILLLKDRDAIPIYLKGNMYIPFWDDSQFNSSVINVVDQISGKSGYARPPKTNSVKKTETAYSFTRTEDIIKLNSKKRNCLVDRKEGTDFSGENRIKFELWETYTPMPSCILALPENVNFSQTAKRAAYKIKNLRQTPGDVVVLRPRPGRPEQALIEKAFEDAGLKTRVYEYTYKDYVWEFCIDEGLKSISPPSVIEHYTDQSLIVENTESDEIQQSAVDYLVDKLKTNSNIAAHLVVASGGMGKTSLCYAIASQLYNNNDLKSTAVTIHSETIKKYINENGTGSIKIDSIFDLYDVYSKQAEYDQVFDRSSFELAVLCGNLIVLIDGLDELVSVFQGRFDLDLFFKSISALHNELASSKILITTRSSSVLSSLDLQTLNIQNYGLLGFDASACDKYLKKRFRGFPDSEKLVQKVASQIANVNLDDSENRIVPFFVDIAATVAEDQIKESVREDLKIVHTATPYPSNNELVDHIIHSVFRREETRHGFNINPFEAIQFLSNLVVDYGSRFPREEVLNRLKILYDNRAEEIINKISINPLLVSNSEFIGLKYGFLSSYLEVLFIIDGIVTKTKTREFLKTLAKLGANTQEFKDVKKYFVKHISDFDSSIQPLIKSLNEISFDNHTNSLERERAKGAISVLISILSSIKHVSGERFKNCILEAYGVSPEDKPSERKLLRGFYISGDLPAFDFDGLTVSESRFKGYKNFLNSKFGNTEFMYSTFEGCGNLEIKSTSFKEEMIDATCEVGDLSHVFGILLENGAREEKMIEDEAKRFLGSFFRGDRFRDNNKMHIRTSNKVAGLGPDKINKIISMGYLKISTEKCVDIFYEVSELFQPSVRRFLANNYIDSKMAEFLNFVKQR